MKTHRFDAFSFVFGLIFLGVGLVLLSGNAKALSFEWVGPAVAILLGAMILVAARPERPPKVEAPLPEAADGSASTEHLRS